MYLIIGFIMIFSCVYLIYFGNLHALPLSPSHPHWFSSLPGHLPAYLHVSCSFGDQWAHKDGFRKPRYSITSRSKSTHWYPRPWKEVLPSPSAINSLQVLKQEARDCEPPFPPSWGIEGANCVGLDSNHNCCEFKRIALVLCLEDSFASLTPPQALTAFCSVPWAMEGWGVLFIPRLSPVTGFSLISYSSLQ